MASVIVSNRENRIVTFEGGLAKITRTVVEREIRTADLIEELCKGRPIDTGPLPSNCSALRVCAEASGGALLSLFVIELPPHVQKVVHKRRAVTADEERRPERCIKELLLAWPRTLWLMRFKNASLMDVHLMVSKLPLQVNGYATEVFVMPMPNQYDLGNTHFCTGNITVDLGVPFAKKVDSIISQLLGSMWNDDLAADFSGVGIDSLQKWHDMSANDLDFYTNISFRRHPMKTVEGAMTRLGLPMGAKA